MTTLCLPAAFEARDEEKITETEFLHHVLAHFGGARDPREEVPPIYRGLVSAVGDCLCKASVRSDYEPLSGTRECFAVQKERFADGRRLIDVSILVETFSAASIDDVRVVQSKLDQLRRDHPAFPTQFLATYAASKDSIEVFKFCLSDGVSIDSLDMSSELNPQNRSYAMLDLLYAADWGDFRSSDKWVKIMMTHVLHGESD